MRSCLQCAWLEVDSECELSFGGFEFVDLEEVRVGVNSLIL